MKNFLRMTSGTFAGKSRPASARCIPDDPIAVPHRFSEGGRSTCRFIGDPQRGQRRTILAMLGLHDRLDGAPSAFMKHATADDIRTAARIRSPHVSAARRELFLHALQALTHAYGGRNPPLCRMEPTTMRGVLTACPVL